MQCVENSTAAEIGMRGLGKSIGIFFCIKTDQRQMFFDFVQEQDRRVAAHSMPSRHAGQSRIDFRKAVD